MENGRTDGPPPDRIPVKEILGDPVEFDGVLYQSRVRWWEEDSEEEPFGTPDPDWPGERVTSEVIRLGPVPDDPPR